MQEKNILVVDNDTIILDSLCNFLSEEGYQTRGLKTLNQALKELKNQNYCLVITDLNLPDGNGFELLDAISNNYLQTVVIAITDYGTIESAVTAIKKGAYDYLTKPIVDDDLKLAVERAIKQQSLMNENENLRLQLEQTYSLENILSHDYKMAKVFEVIESAADTTSTILMTGPSGTGKTKLARAIHYRSSRRNNPFIEVSCGALPETLLESELFGHVKGSFTGAVNDKEGKFRAANDGTIFLDEISNASYALQIKLLQVLENKRFQPVGSNKTQTVDVRVLLATNKNLRKQVKEGKFREDLYYRINVVTINLPPLSERVGDVRLLAKHFLQMYCVQHTKKKLGITDDAMEYLERYPWPGNIRELENTIERAVLLSKSQFIGPDDLPDFIKNNQPRQKKYKTMSLKQALEQPEKDIVRQTLQAHHWNRKETAKALMINRTTLFKKMKKYSLYKEIDDLGLL